MHVVKQVHCGTRSNFYHEFTHDFLLKGRHHNTASCGHAIFC